MRFRSFSWPLRCSQSARFLSVQFVTDPTLLSDRFLFMADFLLWNVMPYFSASLSLSLCTASSSMVLKAKLFTLFIVWFLSSVRNEKLMGDERKECLLCRLKWYLLDVGLLFVSDQCVAAWHPNAVLFIVLQHNHFLPDHKPGWYLYDLGVFVSSQTEHQTNGGEKEMRKKKWRIHYIVECLKQLPLHVWAVGTLCYASMVVVTRNICMTSSIVFEVVFFFFLSDVIIFDHESQCRRTSECIISSIWSVLVPRRSSIGHDAFYCDLPARIARIQSTRSFSFATTKYNVYCGNDRPGNWSSVSQ